MAFLLSEVTSDNDFDELIPLLWRSYAKPRVTFLPLLFPAEDDSPEAHEKQIAQCKMAMMHLHHSDPSSHWLKVTDTSTGRVIAGCRWHTFRKDPYSHAPESKPFVVTSWPDGDRRKYATLCIGNVIHPRKTRHRKPHVSLQICFTDPAYRGRGAGSLMMGWGVRKADEMGLDSFVEASEIGSHLYKKFGFVTVSEEQTDTTVPNPSKEWQDMVTRFPPLVVYWMWRPINGLFDEQKTVLPW